MDTLNLDGRSPREDNFFQRIFWPTIENQYDVDTATRRGFWLAIVVGVFSAVGLLLAGNWALALFILLTYWLGANGIRERSLAAAILLLTMYLLNIGFTWVAMLAGASGGRNPVAGILGIALLLSCVRATLLSRQFAQAGDTEFPDRQDDSLTDRLVDRIPPVLWPRARIAFFVLASAMLALSLAGQVLMLSTQLHHPAVQAEPANER